MAKTEKEKSGNSATPGLEATLRATADKLRGNRDVLMKAHEEESRTPAALHEALLRKLLSGELRVPTVLEKMSAAD